MKKELVTRENIDELLRFIPLFEEPRGQFIRKWGGGEKMTDGAMTMPYPIYADDVEQFFALASQPCWCDYSYNSTEALKMLDDDEFVKKATIENIKTMLTYCVRGERFCDVFWGSVLDSGRVVAVLKRLKVLRDAVV